MTVASEVREKLIFFCGAVDLIARTECIWCFGINIKYSVGFLVMESSNCVSTIYLTVMEETCRNWLISLVNLLSDTGLVTTLQQTSLTLLNSQILSSYLCMIGFMD